MHIVLFCATNRGLLFLKQLRQVEPHAQLTVFSFREEPWEPPFLDQINAFAAAHGCSVYETRNVAQERLTDFWESSKIDLAFAVSWRYMIPQGVYERPRLGTFVFHDSLLPKYRGFSPTVWAMLNGEPETGVTLFKIADTVDSGPVVDQERVSIGFKDSISNVLERVTQCYLCLLERNFDDLVARTVKFTPQDESAATYTCRLTPDDVRIDWGRPTLNVYNMIRAYSSPYPGAYTFFEERKLRVLTATFLDESRNYIGRIPGRVVEIRKGAGIVVLTGDGELLLEQIRLDDGETARADALISSTKATFGHAGS